MIYESDQRVEESERIIESMTEEDLFISWREEKAGRSGKTTTRVQKIKRKSNCVLMELSWLSLQNQFECCERKRTVERETALVVLEVLAVGVVGLETSFVCWESTCELGEMGKDLSYFRRISVCCGSA